MSGIYIGSIMELLTIQYGIQGIMLYFTMILPQGIFYILGFMVLGCWCLNQDKYESTLKDRKKVKIRNIKHKKALALSLFLVVIGIIMESYVKKSFCRYVVEWRKC